MSSHSLQTVRALKAHNVNVVFDIGANTGQFATDLRAYGYMGLIVSFELFPDAYEQLTKVASQYSNWVVHERCAVGAESGSIDINVSGNSVSSAILPMLKSHLESAPQSKYTHTVEAKIITLDSIFAQYCKDIDNVLFKIDTQGFEWQVLDGATESLTMCKGLLLELSLVPLYGGQRLWQEFISRLASLKLFLYAIQPSFIDDKTSQTLQFDGIFIKKIMNEIEKIPKLSIVTVTLNAANHIQHLINSLQNQTCKDFEWIIADGESKDRTLYLISKAVGLNVSVASAPDFGIYDAMNKGIKIARASHYLVIGADDKFEPHTVQSIVDDLDSDPAIDILIGQVKANGQLIKLQKGRSSTYGARAYITAHSVGSVIKKTLHEKFGFYGNKYSIIADSALIKKIFSSKNIKTKYSDVVYGTFATGGISNIAIVQSHCEFLSLQLATEKHKIFQIFLFIARYAKFRLSKIDKKSSFMLYIY